MFLDPLYGPIQVDDRIRALIFAPEFQRLRYVRLCNINSLYLTGASEPKRFEHCIGVAHLADAWARSRSLPPKDADVLKAAALLHDIQTAPFGHSFQYVLEDNPFDQRFEHGNLAAGASHRFLQRTNANAHFSGRPFAVQNLLGDLTEDVFAAIDGRGPFGPLISGTLDLDNLDNVVRLAFHMGLCDDRDRALPLALTPLIELRDGRFAAQPGAEPLLRQWFEIRRRLYEFLLLDRGEFAAKAMLTRAVELAARKDLLGPQDWLLTDDDLLASLQSRSVGENQAIGQIVKRLRVGDLFYCVDVWSSADTALYEQFSNATSKRALEETIDEDLAKHSGVRLRVCLHYILDNKKTCRSLSFLDSRTGEEKSVGHDSKSLLVGAFVMNERAGGLSAAERGRASGAVKDVLGRAGLSELQPARDPLAEPESGAGLFQP